MNLLLFKNEDQAQNRLDLSEYQRMTLIMVLLIESIASVTWQLFANNQLILLLTLILHVLAIWLAFRTMNLSGVVWAAAVSAVVIASVDAYEAPLVAALLGLMPLVAVLIFGLVPGILTAGLVAVLMFSMPGRYPDLRGLQGMVGPVILGGTAALLLGGIFRYWMVDTIRVYYENYLKANAGIEEAREQRVELKQIQEDLIHANREMIRLTRQLKLANQAAEEARQAKETFVATVSHELRTPLNMIIGFSEVIAQSPQVYGTRLPPTLLADIASIQRNSQHLLELVNDVLDLSQVDMGNLAIARNLCSLSGLVNEAFDVIRPLFTSKGLYLKADLPAEDLTISCDQTRIREVIINLLSNAGRFTEKGGVLVKARLDGSLLEVGMQDSGPGISPENQKKLFEPFQQLDSSNRRKHGGSGLGLAISKRFVEMHGGQMWLESTIGEGTTFYFSLPMQSVETVGTGTAARWVNSYASIDPRPRAFKAPQATQVSRCVILEENDKASHLFERYMREVEIVSVRDAEGAIESSNKSPTQLLVINHPQAADLLQAVLSSGRIPFGLPVISFWLPGSADMAAALNIEKYLIKPVSKEALMDAVESIGDSIPKTILLVDDNPEVLQLFGRILASSDKKYSVLRASDGRQALQMLRKRRPDALVLDLVMPGLNGFQVLKEKAADPQIQGIPVIVISAQDPAGVQKVNDPVILAREGGFSPRDLLELVKSIGFASDNKARPEN